MPGRSRLVQLTLHEAPDSDVDAPPLDRHWPGNRLSPCDHHRRLLTKMGYSWFIGGSNRPLARAATLLG
jgi:hypothetical protein